MEIAGTDITSARKALEAAEATRARFRGVSRSDPDRRQALEAADAEVANAGSRLHDEVRRGPLRHDRRRNPTEVEALSRAITAERSKLWSALNGTTAAASKEGLSFKRYRSSVGHTAQSIASIEREFGAVRRVATGADRREALTGLAEQLHTLRVHARKQFRAFDDYYLERRKPVGFDALWETGDEQLETISKLRRHVREAAPRPRRGARQMTKAEAVERVSERNRKRKRGRWSKQSIRDAFAAFRVDYGRDPTTRDLLLASDLPSYASVRRYFDSLHAVLWDRESILSAFYAFEDEHGRNPRGSDFPHPDLPARAVVEWKFGSVYAALQAL